MTTVMRKLCIAATLWLITASATGAAQITKGFVAGTLVIALRGSDGLALASDRRMTLDLYTDTGPIQAKYDDNQKLFGFAAPHNFVAVMTAGTAVFGSPRAQVGDDDLLFDFRDDVARYGSDSSEARAAAQKIRAKLLTFDKFMPQFSKSLPATRLTVDEFADRLRAYLDSQWRANPPEPGTPNPLVFVAGVDANKPRAVIVSFHVGRSSAKTEYRDLALSGRSGNLVAPVMFGPGADLQQIVDRDLANLSASDRQRVVDLVQERSLRKPFKAASPPTANTCADAAQYAIRTLIEIQDALSTPNAFGLGGAIDRAIITHAAGFERR
jgi:hypothetical protein